MGVVLLPCVQQIKSACTSKLESTRVIPVDAACQTLLKVKKEKENVKKSPVNHRLEHDNREPVTENSCALQQQ